jgi:hypothetical protein
LSPSWPEIRKSGAMAFIRTDINYFLSKKMNEEKQVSAGETDIQVKTENNNNNR